MSRRFAAAAVLSALATFSGIALTATAGWLIFRAAEQPPVLFLTVAMVGVRLFGLARPVLRYAERLLGHDAVLTLLAERRASFVARLLPLVPARLGRRRGELLSGLVDDVDAELDRRLRVVLPRWGFLGAVVAVVVAEAALGQAWSVPVAAGVALATLAACAAATPAVRFLDARATALRAELAAVAADAHDNAEEYRLWQAEDVPAARVAALGIALRSLGTRSALVVGLAKVAVLLAAGAGIAATVALSDASAPMTALLALVPLALADPAVGVVETVPPASRARAAEARLESAVRQPPAVAGPGLPEVGARPFALPTPWEGPRTDSVHPGPATAPDIALDRVSAEYEPGVPVLRELSLEIAPGEKVALAGESGSGKSTAMALLWRALDPSVGTVSVAGTDARAWPLDDLRALMAVTDDDPHVFASTLAENVRFARPDASDEDIAAALERAALGDWLAALPDGLDTLLGEGGWRPSGGERARLALARALLADAPVMLFDEPVAHLDRDTATRLAEAATATPGTTVVWVSHSPVGLERMDRVVTLEAPDPAPRT